MEVGDFYLHIFSWLVSDENLSVFLPATSPKSSCLEILYTLLGGGLQQFNVILKGRKRILDLVFASGRCVHCQMRSSAGSSLYQSAIVIDLYLRFVYDSSINFRIAGYCVNRNI